MPRVSGFGNPKNTIKEYKISFFYVLGEEEGRKKEILPWAPKKLWGALLPRKKTKCYYWGIERLKKPVIHVPAESELVMSWYYLFLTAPSGPPTSLYATRTGARNLQVFWSPPEPKKQNGHIIGYRLCIKEKRFSFPCRNYVMVPESQIMNMHSFNELKPFTFYNIHVEAKTFVGYGPGQYLNYSTGEAGI